MKFGSYVFYYELWRCAKFRIFSYTLSMYFSRTFYRIFCIFKTIKSNFPIQIFALLCIFGYKTIKYAKISKKNFWFSKGPPFGFYTYISMGHINQNLDKYMQPKLKIWFSQISDLKNPQICRIWRIIGFILKNWLWWESNLQPIMASRSC